MADYAWLRCVPPLQRLQPVRLHRPEADSDELGVDSSKFWRAMYCYGFFRLFNLFSQFVCIALRPILMSWDLAGFILGQILRAMLDYRCLCLATVCSASSTCSASRSASP